MNEYEDFSITAATNVLDFLCYVDDFKSLNEELSRFKEALVLYGSDHSKEHFQAISLSVDTLTGMIQQAVSTSSIFGMRILLFLFE